MSLDLLETTLQDTFRYLRPEVWRSLSPDNQAKVRRDVEQLLSRPDVMYVHKINLRSALGAIE